MSNGTKHEIILRLTDGKDKSLHLIPPAIIAAVVESAARALDDIRGQSGLEPDDLIEAMHDGLVRCESCGTWGTDFSHEFEEWAGLDGGGYFCPRCSDAERQAARDGGAR